EEEYFELFSSAGWTHVASDAGFHLFRAVPGTIPIYSDRETSLEKYNNMNTFVNKLTIPLCIVTALIWFSTFFSSGQLKSILLIVAIILTALALPAVWTAIAAYSNKLKNNGKTKISIGIKVAPPIFFIATFIILILIFNPDRGG